MRIGFYEQGRTLSLGSAQRLMQWLQLYVYRRFFADAYISATNGLDCF